MVSNMEELPNYIKYEMQNAALTNGVTFYFEF